MAIYIKSYDLTKVKSIPMDEYVWCRNNNFDSRKKADHGHWSFIKIMLEECLNNAYGTLFLAHNGEKNVGWGIAYPYENEEGKKTNVFQVYVPPRQRRKGIGSRILKKACKAFGKLEVFDISTSGNFYRNNGLTKGGNITGKKLKA